MVNQLVFVHYHSSRSIMVLLWLFPVLVFKSPINRFFVLVTFDNSHQMIFKYVFKVRTFLIGGGLYTYKVSNDKYSVSSNFWLFYFDYLFFLAYQFCKYNFATCSFIFIYSRTEQHNIIFLILMPWPFFVLSKRTTMSKLYLFNSSFVLNFFIHYWRGSRSKCISLSIFRSVCFKFLAFDHCFEW